MCKERWHRSIWSSLLGRKFLRITFVVHSVFSRSHARGAMTKAAPWLSPGHAADSRRFRPSADFQFPIWGHSELEGSCISSLQALFSLSAQGNTIRGIYSSQLKLTIPCSKDICLGESYRPILCQFNLMHGWNEPEISALSSKIPFLFMTINLFAECLSLLFPHFHIYFRPLASLTWHDCSRRHLEPTTSPFRSCAALSHGLHQPTTPRRTFSGSHRFNFKCISVIFKAFSHLTS
jgi:hypothetical protein